MAKLKGMNQMSATILSCKATTDEILNMLPEQRIEEFGFLIGLDAVVCHFFSHWSFGTIFNNGVIELVE